MKARRRDYRHSSPLDRMPDALQAATDERASRPGVTLRNLREWLRETHDVKTSVTALCEWLKRRQGAGQRFEIEVSAPGATEIRVRVSAPPEGKSGVVVLSPGCPKGSFEMLESEGVGPR